MNLPFSSGKFPPRWIGVRRSSAISSFTSRKHAVAPLLFSGNYSPTMCDSPSKPNPPFPFVSPSPKHGMDKGMRTRECLCFVLEMLVTSIPLS